MFFVLLFSDTDVFFHTHSKIVLLYSGADADGCPYAPALYAEDACAADPDGACASSDDCDPGLVCCYSFECGDNWCVTQSQSGRLIKHNIEPRGVYQYS